MGRSKRRTASDAQGRATDAKPLDLTDNNSLEIAIGTEVRAFRRNLGMTVAEVARQAGLSMGMLSKIENANTSPSLATLQALAQALHVPVTSLFRRYEETRDATFVKAGQGLQVERRGTRAGHKYQILGHTTAKRYALEPYLMTLTHKSEVFPLFQRTGTQFIYLLEGRVTYRHGDKTYDLEPGDSLFFDAGAPHGPEELKRLPVRYLAIIAYPRTVDEDERVADTTAPAPKPAKRRR
ncbi:MAG: helix-turn-helix domain-containing protein [Alphaproteobacteria bacterium]|nr:helix-turn-helix domain-containing protein [Alphaproteobacteria bacterium]